MRVYGSVNIKLPFVPSHLNVTNVEQIDPALLDTMELAVSEWAGIIEEVIKRESGRARQNKYPMAEIELWRERSSSVSTLYEQLQLPAVQNVLKLLSKHPQQSSLNTYASFEDQFVEL